MAHGVGGARHRAALRRAARLRAPGALQRQRHRGDERQGQRGVLPASATPGVGAGILVFAGAAKFDAERLERWAWPLMLLAIAAMVAVLIPGVGWKLNGSRRSLFHGSFQASEFAKLAVVIWVPMLVVKKGEALRR